MLVSVRWSDVNDVRGLMHHMVHVIKQAYLIDIIDVHVQLAIDDCIYIHMCTHTTTPSCVK